MKSNTKTLLLNLIDKSLPESIKQRLISSIKNAILHLDTVSHASSTDIANNGQDNPWWQELQKQSNGKIFINSDSSAKNEAKNACNEIRQNYHPILEQYGVDSTEFFMGSIKNEDAEALYALVRAHKPQIAYQVGTFVGYSAMVIAHALKANGKGRLIAVDPEIPHRTFINPVGVAREAARVLGLKQQVQFERGCHSIALGDFIGYKMGKQVPVVGRSILEKLEGEIDFAFIDGDHSVSATIADFMTLKDFLKLGGVTVFHDVYSWPTVAHAISIILDDNYFYMRGTRAYFSMDTSPGWDGLVAFEHIDRSKIPVMQIKVISEQTREPIPCSLIRVPALGLEARTGDDGAAYIYHELYPDTEIEVHSINFAPYIKPLGKETAGDYSEILVELTAGEHAADLNLLLNKHEPLVFTWEKKDGCRKPPPAFETSGCKPLYNNIPIQFQYSCKIANLSRLGCLFGTYKRKNSGQVTLLIREEKNNKDKVLRESTIDSSILHDNDFTTFLFDPIKESEGKNYSISLEFKNGTPNRCPGLWYGEFTNTI